MAIREVELPGVGKKFTVETQAKGRLVIVLHHSGKREIYHFPGQVTVPDKVIDLNTEEAHQVGGILSQTYFQPTPDPARELVMKGLTIEWLTLPAGHEMASRTISDLGVRKRTGATIIAILREGKTVINPDPAETLLPQDTLMVIGTDDQVRAFLSVFNLSVSGD
jgi:TrkA domain protein